MKIGLLSYPLDNRSTNLGDEIQAIAAEQFLPRWDSYIERAHLASYSGLAEDIFFIANGFFFFHDKNEFPLGDSLKPLWTALHIALDFAYLKDDLEAVNYFRPHQPIGCRDFATMHFLQKHNIEVYFSGCLTLTLKRENFNPQKREKVFFADILGKTGKADYIRIPLEYKRLWGKEINYLEQHIRYRKRLLGIKFLYKKHRDHTMRIAHQRLCSYASARFVVTSRLHAALPCLAFGTPVLFVYEKRKEGEEAFCTLDDPRFGGLLEHVTKIDRDSFYEGLEEGVWEIDGKRQSWEEIENPNTHQGLAEQLRARTQAQVNAMLDSA